MKDKAKARNRKQLENDLRGRLNQTKVNYRRLWNDHKELKGRYNEVLKGFDRVNQSIDSWLGAAVLSTGKKTMVLKKEDLVKKYFVKQTQMENGDYLVEIQEL